MQLKPIQLVGIYIIDQVKKKSKARYAVDIAEGDKIRFVMQMESTVGASGGGNYVLYADMYVNDNFKCKISQNEFDKFTSIFDVMPADIN